MLNLRQTYCDNRLPLGLQLTDDPGMNQELRLQLTNRPSWPAADAAKLDKSTSIL